MKLIAQLQIVALGWQTAALKERNVQLWERHMQLV
jgi:hypothetical protein